MKTLTPKSANKEKTSVPSEDNSVGWLVYLTIGSNMATFLVVMVIAYIVTMSGIYHYKHNIDASSHQNNDQLKWAEVNNGLDDIKMRLDELQKQYTEAATRDPNWQKMSRDYHVQLLFNIIKNKIISGDDFRTEMEELNKFAIDDKSANFQTINNYLATDRLKVSELLSNLYDEAANRTKHPEGEGFINSVRHFFTNLFTVKKVDENKIHATSNEITSIIVQLLLEGRIQAAYVVASKFRGVDEGITKIADALRPASDALAAVDKLNGMVNG